MGSRWAASLARVTRSTPENRSAFDRSSADRLRRRSSASSPDCPSVECDSAIAVNVRDPIGGQVLSGACESSILQIAADHCTSRNPGATSSAPGEPARVLRPTPPIPNAAARAVQTFEQSNALALSRACPTSGRPSTRSMGDRPGDEPAADLALGAGRGCVERNPSVTASPDVGAPTIRPR